MDDGSRKWLVGFLLAGVGVGSWLLSGLDDATARTLSPLFLVALPLAILGVASALRTMFGARIRPLVWIRRHFGRSAEDSAVIVWFVVAGAVTGKGISSLVPWHLEEIRVLLLLGFPVAAGVLSFCVFGSRWTPARRLLVAILWTLGAPSAFLATTLLVVFGLVEGAHASPLGALVPAIPLGLAATILLTLQLHARITGERIVHWFRSTRETTTSSWRQIAAILSRAGFRPSNGAWVGPLGRGEACVQERNGRVSVQVSGFRSDVTLRAGVAGPPSVLTTGDEAFDGQVRVSGEPIACFAAFVPAAREALLRVLDRFPSLHLVDGDMVADGEVPASRFLESLRELAAASEALGEPGHEGERVLQILRTDPTPRVRAHALDLLLNSSIVVPEDAARAALADLPGPEVTLAAAFQLGVEGGRHLERLLGPASSQLLRAKALDAIAARCDDATWAAAATKGLADPEARIRHGVLRAIASRWVSGSDELAARALADPAPTVREAAVALFVARGMGVQQKALFPVALTDPDSAVRRQAIAALGSIGGMEAVEALVPLRTAGGEFGRLAGQAIKEIQDRLPGGARGSLSLSDGDTAGRLSPATQGGSLAVADAESGALSMAQAQAKKLPS